MAKAYANDLRRRVLEAHEQRESTIAQLAQRFRVSVGYVQKIVRQYRTTHTMDRIPHRPGRKPKFTAPIRQQLQSWLKTQPDLTLVELQEKLDQQSRLKVSVPSLWEVLRKMGLHLKKVGLRARTGFPCGPAEAPRVSGKAERDRRVAMGVCG